MSFKQIATVYMVQLKYKVMFKQRCVSIASETYFSCFGCAQVMTQRVWSLIKLPCSYDDAICTTPWARLRCDLENIWDKIKTYISTLLCTWVRPYITTDLNRLVVHNWVYTVFSYLQHVSSVSCWHWLNLCLNLLMTVVLQLLLSTVQCPPLLWEIVLVVWPQPASVPYLWSYR